MVSRRNFLSGAGAITAAVGSATVSKAALAALPEPVIQTSADTAPPWITPVAGSPTNRGS